MVQILFFFGGGVPDTRTTRYEEAFLPEGKKRFRSLRSLDLASLKQEDKKRHVR